MSTNAYNIYIYFKSQYRHPKCGARIINNAHLLSPVIVNVEL